MNRREEIIEKIAKALKKNYDNNDGTSSYINFATQVYQDVVLPTLDEIEKPLKYINEIMSQIDCGSNSCCYITERGKGMRTNASCTCFVNKLTRKEDELRQLIPQVIRKELSIIQQLRGEK